MRVLFDTLPQRGFLHDDLHADYVYMYPPRQAYGAFGAFDAGAAATASLAGEPGVDLYFHFPFCEQICSFCNLFSVGAKREEGYAGYVDTLLREFETYRGALRGKHVATIYLGGGTPSLLPPEEIDRVLRAVENVTGCSVADVAEVSMESSVNSFTAEKFREFRAIGVNRINLGLQSFDRAELEGAGRGHEYERAAAVVEAALAVGFRNVCVDLIYGLQGQSDESWRSSVRALAALKPETICLYAATLRPQTGYARAGYHDVAPSTLYRRYDVGLDLLSDAGYAQENHVRFRSGDNGGYVQKANHWAGRNILGFGAGARSYLQGVDLRNGYSARHRRRVLRDYVERVDAGVPAHLDGFAMDREERLRKRVILGLGCLDVAAIEADVGIDPMSAFEAEFSLLFDEGALETWSGGVALTPKGIRHRDVIAQLFFSTLVRDRLRSYAYDD